jgi:hypothetical protein
MNRHGRNGSADARLAWLETKTDRGLGLPTLLLLVLLSSFLTNLSPIRSELALDGLLIAVQLRRYLAGSPTIVVGQLLPPVSA